MQEFGNEELLEFPFYFAKTCRKFAGLYIVESAVVTLANFLMELSKITR